VTFGGRSVFPDMAVRLLFCNSLHDQKSMLSKPECTE